MRSFVINNCYNIYNYHLPLRRGLVFVRVTDNEKLISGFEVKNTLVDLMLVVLLVTIAGHVKNNECQRL